MTKGSLNCYCIRQTNFAGHAKQAEEADLGSRVGQAGARCSRTVLFREGEVSLILQKVALMRQFDSQLTFVPSLITISGCWAPNPADRSQESLQCTDNGTLKVLSKSFQEYKFTAEGMTRHNSGPAMEQPYKVLLRCAEQSCCAARGCSH